MDTITITSGLEASILPNAPPELVCNAYPAVAAYVYTAVVALVNLKERGEQRRRYAG